MKPFSLSLFNLVFAFTFYASSGWGQTSNPEKSREECFTAPDTSIIDACKGDASPTTCQSTKCTQNYRSKAEIKADAKDEAQKCDSANDKYNESLKDYPCTGNNKAVCDACLSGINEGTGDGDALGGLFSGVSEIIKSKQTTTAEGATPAANDPCSKVATNDKSVKEAKTARKKRMDEIKKEIQEEKKKISESNKKLNEDKQAIQKEQQELADKINKLLRDTTTKQREKANDLQKTVAASQAKVRGLQKNLMDKRNAAEKAKFDYQNNMLDYTADKINSQCKSALETAKSCYIKSRNGAALPQGDTCANFTLSGRGALATADLRNKLTKVRDACFEQANKTVSTLKFQNAAQIRDLDESMKQTQDDIDAANAELKHDQDDYAAVISEILKEKEDEQKSIQTQMDSLTQKQDALIKQTNQDIADTNLVIADLQKELNELLAGKLAEDLGVDDGGTISSLVRGSLTATEEDIQRKAGVAQRACCPTPSGMTGEQKGLRDNLCKQLSTSAKVKTTKGSSKTKTTN